MGFSGFPGHEERLGGGTFSMVSRNCQVMRVFVVGTFAGVPGFPGHEERFHGGMFLNGFIGFPGHEERLSGGTFSLVSRDFSVMRTVFVVCFGFHWCPVISRP